MKFNTMPKEVACELLTYIVEKEDFETVCSELDGDFSARSIKALLREIARNLQEELKNEKPEEYDPSKCKYLTSDAKKIITYLTPKEEKTLLKAFGLAEDQKK